MGDHRPSGLRSSYRSAEVAASICSASAVPQPIQVKPMDRWEGPLSRDDMHVVRFRKCGSRIDTKSPADDDENRRIWPTEVSPPRRSLPPSSDVQHRRRVCPNRRPATTQLACVERCFKRGCRRRQTPRRVPPPTACLRETSPTRNKPGWWRGSGTRTLGSGSETWLHGGKHVVALGAGNCPDEPLITETGNHEPSCRGDKRSKMALYRAGGMIYS